MGFNRCLLKVVKPLIFLYSRPSSMSLKPYISDRRQYLFLWISKWNHALQTNKVLFPLIFTDYANHNSLEREREDRGLGHNTIKSSTEFISLKDTLVITTIANTENRAMSDQVSSWVARDKKKSLYMKNINHLFHKKNKKKIKKKKRLTMSPLVLNMSSPRPSENYVILKTCIISNLVKKLDLQKR